MNEKRRDPLDAGLSAAFRATGSGSPPSVLTVLARKVGASPRLSLQEDDTASGRAPIIHPGSEELRSVPQGRGNYQLLGEIARGGMGVVLKGHDTDLGRDVALKVLHRKLADDPAILQRFVEEAQIGGQLQHPGIVPVYELGLMADERPYFTMKLVKGRTLAKLLSDRESPSADRRRLLDVFSSVCQTMAYAHSRGVIHRDLKPSNVMVGAFGEVQVVDWGLAKVLKRGGCADEERAEEAHSAVTVLDTVRSAPESGSSHSVAGSVMGTPAYMPPEQAGGHVQRLDERSDVFSLGAILCEILTGAPPYVADPPGRFEQTLAQAVSAQQDSALARLDACDADLELIELAKLCMKPAQPARPRSAEVLADRLGRHLESVEERARKAQIEAVEAHVREQEAGARLRQERRARKLTVALAATVLVAALGAGGGWLFLREQANARARLLALDVNAALNEASLFRGQAKWDAALAAGNRALDLAERGGADAGTRAWIEDSLSGIRLERDRARFLADLEQVLVFASQGADPDPPMLDRSYGEVFARYGFDLDRTSPEQSSAALRSRGLGSELATILDRWIQARHLRGDREGELRLIEVAHGVDPDPVRADVREALLNDDLEELRQLAKGELREQAPSTLLLLGFALFRLGDLEESLRVGYAAVDRYPDDLMLEFGLSKRLFDSRSPERALPHMQAMVALDPESAFARGWLANGYEALADRVQAGGDARRAGELRRRAAVSYSAALELDPDDEGLRAGLERLVDGEDEG